MSGIELRPGAIGARDLFSLLNDLGLDADVNPCSAAIGPVDPERIRDRDEFLGFVRRLGLNRALANVVDVAEEDVTVGLVVHDETVRGDVDELRETVSAHHNAHPLGPGEVLRVECWPHASGEHVVFVKICHLVVDLADAVDLVARIRAYLRGAEPGRVRSRYRGHEEILERYAELPAADTAVVQRMLGDVPAPGRKGVPTVGRSADAWLPLRPRVSFDEILSAAAATVLEVVGGGLVLQYPFSRWEFVRHGGYFVEIRPLVLDPTATSEYTPEYFRETRQRHEALGRFTMSDLTSFTAALTAARTPRIVVSDTTFMRPGGGDWRWIPVVADRMFEDLKFLADRSRPAEPLLRLQYKPRFLDPADLAAVLEGMRRRVGADGEPATAG